MSADSTKPTAVVPVDTHANTVAEHEPVPAFSPEHPQQPVELGGRDGPEPTRFGDWEKAGRCIDF
ncbi:MAG: DUF1674 domain-containing protein [Steroidobacteraceae bacterium]